MIKIPSNDIVSRELVSKINMECEKSDRLTVAKLNTVSKPYKQDYKSKLMTEEYSLLPINSQQLTPAQTAIQRMSEKHLDFEIQAVNVRHNLAMHRSVTSFIIRQPIWRPHLLERVYKPMHTPH